MTQRPEDRIQFDATVDEKGKVHPAGAREVTRKLTGWRGRRVLVTVERFKKLKTNPQLAFYYGAIVPVWAEECGYHKDEAHEELKRAFLARVRVTSKLTGEEIEEVPSLRDVTSEQMSEYISRLMVETARNGWTVESPEEWCRRTGEEWT